ncbi:hypothetical protein HPB47_006989 [Ixodes persulcatus]|uniref:Uncharacterized protein n=1 Tax=Ixodes persulcatus TaxID=34615 RepID=A0AC60P8M2_IXOPE|nr:hypothetical protein HPB47_006989 [Ixodes persulcatus]
MSSTGKPGQIYREIEGLYLSYYFPDAHVRSTLAYKPQPGDVFIVSYPKCGTTWTQNLVLHIFSGGISPRDRDEFQAKTPFLEASGAECIAYMPRPGAMKTHLPFHKQPYSDQAKYLYVTRNPYDCCVSYYYHTRAFPAYFFQDGTFDEFFDMFIEGRCEYGDYFDHLLSWYGHRHDRNVLFLTYEGLKRDTEGWVLKMADFLGNDYGEKLRSDPFLARSIVEASGVENMKKLFNESLKSRKYAPPPPSGKVQKREDVGDEVLKDVLEKPITGDFVRKGVVGDWRNHFSREQVERMKRWIALKTAGSDVMQLWKDEDLP